MYTCNLTPISQPLLAVGSLNYYYLYIQMCHFEVALMVKLSWERVPKSGALYI